MTEYFLDASYIIALELEDDQNHQQANAYWKQIQQQQPDLVTTSYVFDEVVTYLNNRRHHQKAVQLGQELLNSSDFTFLHVDTPLFYSGWMYFRQHQDKRYSLTDCISFVVMQQHSIQVALTFDQHFTQAGFNREPL